MLQRLAVKLRRIRELLAFKNNRNAQVHVREGHNILDEYVQIAPTDQNALNIFKGEWSSRLPGRWKDLEAGAISLFDDARIVWAAEQLGGFNGQRILELGPLEAGHTYMLESLGAESILAIEANTRAYLKCLVVKEILGLNRSRFVLGDFISFLRQNEAPFDVCLASGVLYHMQNPCELIQLISQTSKKIILWTHYYDQKFIQTKARVAEKFSSHLKKNHNGFEHAVYKYSYGDALNWTGFCGGGVSHSYWMSRDDILACLRFFDFQDLKIGFEDPDHKNGPSFCVIGIRGE